MALLAKEKYNRIYENVFKVYDIFKNFFGEEHVDLQNVVDENYWQDGDIDVLKNIADSLKPFILVYWPVVTVTNEFDKCIIIYDLYAKIPINIAGLVPWESHGFTLNRSTYPLDQFVSGYMHSHVQCIPIDNFSNFMHPCLGNGPIKETIHSLRSTNSEEMWMLFCHELSMYVTVESIAGVPYNRLENVTTAGRHSYGYNTYESSVILNWLFYYYDVFGENTKNIIRDFIQYYLDKGNLKFTFVDERFDVGMPFQDFIIDISNTFIDFYNTHIKNPIILEKLNSKRALEKVRMKNGKFVRADNISDENYNQYEGAFICKFKGKDVTLHIMNVRQSQNSGIITILKPTMACGLLNEILKTINYRYENKRNRNKEGEPVTTTERTVCFV